MYYSKLPLVSPLQLKFLLNPSIQYRKNPFNVDDPGQIFKFERPQKAHELSGSLHVVTDNENNKISQLEWFYNKIVSVPNFYDCKHL